MSEAAVTVSHLSKAFGSRAVLRDISSEVQPGDVVGVIGKNGAGKTTLLETLLGFSPPSTASAHTNGLSYSRRVMRWSSNAMQNSRHAFWILDNFSGLALAVGSDADSVA